MPISDQILSDVLRLPDEEQRAIADAVYARLVGKRFSGADDRRDELRRRLVEVVEGRAELIPANELFAGLRSKRPAPTDPTTM